MRNRESHDAVRSLTPLARHYLDAVLDSDRHGATALVQDAVENGASVRDIYMTVFQPVQQLLGLLWQKSEISVAQEHFSTAVTQLNMSLLYSHIFTSEKNGRHLVATCVGGELHEIGVRMVADFFEMEGWDTYYLGANAPAESVVETVQRVGADILAVSTSMTYNIPEVIALIEKAKAADINPELRVLVGGRPFNTDKELWRRVGADLYAPDAQTAINVVNEALQGTSARATDE
ncbi:MAG: cobalamin B12-binding domain-containing protein [Alkalispirochaetaceae bacterium]